MKLIDADKLPWVDKVILVDNVDGDIVIKVAPNYTSYVNKETPTVKAIPIEWIKKWCNIEHKSCEERLMLRYGVITMLEAWEKENETNRQR